MQRRKFLAISSLATPLMAASRVTYVSQKPVSPLVISTWAPNKKANAAAWQVLEAAGSALDAVETGVKVPEADPTDQSVGYGGLPDRDGRVTLDACIMDHAGHCGSVLALEHIKHPVSVARLVMEKTPHIYLAADGALQFALENGFKKEDLLTASSRAAWKKWLVDAKYNPMNTVNNILENIENQHDTIGMLALDTLGKIAGACTTSGMAYKLHGRVGDSPMIGAGLYVDGDIGAASATGVGEEVIRIVGAHTVVELMRSGKSPEQACKEAIGRIVKLKGEEQAKKLQVGLIAMNMNAEYGCYAIMPEFTLAVRDKNGEKIIQSKSWF